MVMKHVAFNIVTGEIISTNHGNHLKHLVKIHNRCNIKDGTGVGKWLFAHNKQGVERIKRKLNND